MMCLAVPAFVEKTHGGEAVVAMHGNRVRVSLALVPDAQVGDWVLVHAGFALQRLDEQEAKETFAVIADVERAGSR